ncbi:MAG: DUF2798 domain-containing protein [Pseudomonadota bacterium]
MLPRRLAPVLFGLFLSGLMSLIVSGISTLRVTGLSPEFPALWLSGWLTSWAVAFPTVLVVAPLARKLVDRLVGHPS